jgi:flagellar biosynthesis/type III secretory pathway protein FliH
VEIHEQDQPMRVAYPGEKLQAPGILRNPVPVDALYDPREANQATFRNLLQRQGYDSIDAILAEGKAEGKMEGKAEGKAEGKLEGLAEGEVSGRLQALQQALFEVVSVRGFRLSEQQRSLIEACTDLEQLSQWLRAAVTATSAVEIFPPGDGAD